MWLCCENSRGLMSYWGRGRLLEKTLTASTYSSVPLHCRICGRTSCSHHAGKRKRQRQKDGCRCGGWKCRSVRLQRSKAVWDWGNVVFLRASGYQRETSRGSTHRGAYKKQDGRQHGCPKPLEVLRIKLGATWLQLHHHETPSVASRLTSGLPAGGPGGLRVPTRASSGLRPVLSIGNRKRATFYP